VSVTPPSPGSPRTDHQSQQLSQPGGQNTTESRPRSRPSSPHLQLKSLLRSPGKKRKAAVQPTPDTAKEKKESSDMDEEGTASEYHDDEITDGMFLKKDAIPS